jgi:hypothetical protein
LSERGSEPVRHLSADQVAAYLDRGVEGADREAIESHLAVCSECRQELRAISGVLAAQTRPGRRWATAAPLVGAAAAVALIFLWPEGESEVPAGPAHREVPIVAEDRPTPVSPVGSVDEAQALEWSRVEGSDRYRVTLYDVEGNTLWRTEARVNRVALPDSILLTPRQAYLWKVEARVEVDRWLPSELVSFRVTPPSGTSASGRSPRRNRPP